MTIISTRNLTGQPLHLMKITKKIEMKLVLSKMHQNSAILAKNWVRIETPTQAPHLTDLSWRIGITRPQKQRKELGT